MMNDTSADAERVLIDALRRQSPERKWLRLGELFAGARLLHAASFRWRNPGRSDRDVLAHWLAVTLDQHMVPSSKDVSMDNLPAFRAVVEVFDRLGIAYALGGSMASSVFGVPRYTVDADVTVDPFPGREAEFVSAFDTDYYLTLAAVQDAMRRKASFNIINTAIGFKVDVFVRRDLPFEESAMARRSPRTFPDLPDQPIVLHSPEDVVLFKLRWYRLGGETSEQQWKDVLGVLKVQAGRLDEDYLDHWAAELQVADLLARARA